jgi:hypothetical protein
MPANWQSFQRQSHQLFAVTDFKTGEVDVDFGDGLTPAPTAGRRRRSSATRSRCRAKSGDSSSGMKAPLNLRSMFPEQSPKQMARNPLAVLQ